MRRFDVGVIFLMYSLVRVFFFICFFVHPFISLKIPLMAMALIGVCKEAELTCHKYFR